MKLPAILLLALLVSAGGCAVKEGAQTADTHLSDEAADGETAFDRDLALLQGTWRPVSMEMDGEFLPEERIGKIRLTIEGENFTFDSGDDSHGGRYQIDPSQDPKQLDIVITRGDEQGKVYLVIYKFADGRMIQCMEVSNANRPSVFSGEAGSGRLYEVWERVE